MSVPAVIPEAGKGVQTFTFDQHNPEVTPMRVLEVALQRWFQSKFFIKTGVPIPVLYTTPMNAFSDFQAILSAKDGPLSYLLALKDDKGTPLYQPHPSAVRLPLITIKRQSWRYSKQRSFSGHWYRQIGWPSVHDSAHQNIKLSDLGEVAMTRMPQAWDYTFQVDFYTNTPQTMAYMISAFMQSMFPSAGNPQAWIYAVYPGYFGKKLVRVYLSGDEISDQTEEEPADGFRFFRQTFSLVVEGWAPFLTTTVVPAFWYLENSLAVSPDTLDKVYDLRPVQENGVVANSAPMPPS